MWLINVETLKLEYHHGPFEADFTERYKATAEYNNRKRHRYLLWQVP